MAAGTLVALDLDQAPRRELTRMKGHVLADRKKARVGEVGHPISPRSPSAQLLVVKEQDDSGDALPFWLVMATLV
jgi:hypothetical protein